MAEYIEREAVLNRLKAQIKQITPIEESRDMFYHDSGMNGAITGAVLEVKNTPTADVAPVVHGRLTSIGMEEMYCEFGRCSVCGDLNPIGAKCCCWCGAHMKDGE